MDIYGNGITDSNAKYSLVQDGLKDARMKIFTSRVSVPLAHPAGDKIFFTKVRMSARISPLSSFSYGVQTGATIDIGDANDPDALLDGGALGSGSSKDLLTDRIGQSGKRMWEVLGYAEDPGGEAAIYGTLSINAPAAADMVLELVVYSS